MKGLNVSRIALIAAGALSAATLGAAAQDEVALDEIVVSANRTATALKSTGSPVVLVQRAEIEESGDPSLAGYFQRIAGMFVRSTGPVGTQTGVQIRGVSQNYIGVTVDGIDVTDPSGTQVSFDFGQLLTTDVGRIEVLKGSQSALYGSNAMGGVIAIETLRPTEQGFHQGVTAEAGSNATRALSYTATFMDDDTEAAVNLSRYRTDGFSTSDQGTEADGFAADRLSFGLAQSFDNGLRLGLNGFADQSESAYDPAYYLDPALLGETINATDVDFMGGDDILIVAGDGGTSDELLTRDSVGLRVFGEFSTGAVDHGLSLTSYRIRRSNHESEVAPDYFNIVDDNDTPDDYSDDVLGTKVQTTDASYVGNRRKAEWTAGFDALGGRIVLGADWASERLEQFGDYGTSDESQIRQGLFGEYTTRLSTGTDLALSVRRDVADGFGQYTTGRVALAHELTADTILRLQAGTGFRAPSTFEQFSIYNPGSLQVETSRSLDFGVEHRVGETGVLRASAFWIQAENLIGFDYAAINCTAYLLGYGSGCYGQVAGLSERSGVELEAMVEPFADVQVRGAYTYTDSSTNASTAWIGVARHSVTVDLSLPVAAGTRANLGLVAAMDRPDFPDGSTAADYAVINASVTHDFAGGTQAYLRLENILDEDYQLTEGYNTPGRGLFAGLRAKF